MKRIIFSRHAKDQIVDRGTTENEVRAAIAEGEPAPAKKGRLAFRKNFPYAFKWKGRYYETKQVMPIVIEEADAIVVVTVYVFYFGGKL
ncbi:MAG: hypothetical protein HY401_01795 [Elusimicrobia bacterium]|nr:hypothetical protein [Elusimicrobiota bacterium]